MSISSVLVTTEELLAMPEDGMERHLISGRIFEFPSMFRSRFHAKALASIGYLIESWNQRQNPPTGTAASGDVGITLRKNPDSTVGTDLAYFAAANFGCQSNDSPMFEIVPILAVEILESSDTFEVINAKIDEYLSVGVKLVWIIDPHFRMVTVYRKDSEPESFNTRQVLSAEPFLPGFQVKVSKIFE